MKKHLTQFALLLLALLLPVSAAAYEFAVDGIYYSRYQESSGTQVKVVIRKRNLININIVATL